MSLELLVPVSPDCGLLLKTTGKLTAGKCPSGFVWDCLLFGRQSDVVVAFELDVFAFSRLQPENFDMVYTSLGVPVFQREKFRVQVARLGPRIGRAKVQRRHFFADLTIYILCSGHFRLNKFIRVHYIYCLHKCTVQYSIVYGFDWHTNLMILSL